MEKVNISKYYLLDSDYDWTKEEIGVGTDSCNGGLGFEEVREENCTRTVLKANTPTQESCIYYNDFPIVVEYINSDMVEDIITGTLFRINTKNPVTVNFGLGNPIASLVVRTILEALKEEDIERYKEKMNLFKKTIEKVNERLTTKEEENVRYINQFKKKYNDQYK